MSDTPRTDREIEVNQLDRYEADWPRKLERECDQLAKQCVKNVEEIGELRAALAISEKKELATRAVISSAKKLDEQIVDYIERVEVQIDGEWGTCQSLEELIEASEMPEIYNQLKARNHE